MKSNNTLFGRVAIEYVLKKQYLDTDPAYTLSTSDTFSMKIGDINLEADETFIAMVEKRFFLFSGHILRCPWVPWMPVGLWNQNQVPSF